MKDVVELVNYSLWAIGLAVVLIAATIALAVKGIVVPAAIVGTIAVLSFAIGMALLILDPMYSRVGDRVVIGWLWIPEKTVSNT